MQDTEIVELYWQRSERAIAETSAKYAGYCTAIARNLLQRSEDAQECVNDTYLGAWNAMPNERPALLRAFLGKITRNLALTRFDYNHAQKRSANLTVLLSELEDCLSSSIRPDGACEAPETAFDKNEVLRALNAFLAGLAPLERRAFVRRYWYADPLHEVAAHLGMSESKAKSMMLRTRKKLRAHLEQEEILV